VAKVALLFMVNLKNAFANLKTQKTKLLVFRFDEAQSSWGSNNGT
jgi:hypothetical protein